MNIFVTGGTGFIGRNIIPALSNKYSVFAPNRKELNLLDYDSVKKYVSDNKIDIIVHTAIPNLLGDDKKEDLFRLSMQMFINIYSMRNIVDKIVYFGSGAEFDKTHPIIRVKEEDFGVNVPNDDYGLAKYTMNMLARQSNNVYNLRVFGCYGPTDADFKLISGIISACVNNKEFRLRNNCVFDYMYVEDIVPILDYFINNTPRYHDYNMCTGIGIENLKVCQITKEIMNSECDIILENTTLGNEYTADNTRLMEEMKDFSFTPIEDGIKKQIRVVR